MNPLLKDVFAEAASVIAAAKAQGVKIATAESCTGGLIGGAITAIEGSSSVFTGGVIAYDNRVKSSLLNVDQDVLAKHGAVSEPVAKAMALSALNELGVDLTVSVTGIAGPGGGSEDKPVGTVWIGIAHRTADDLIVRARLCSYGGIGRNRVRDHTVLDALKALNAALDR